MSIRFDDDKGELQLSVRDLAFVDRRGGVSRDIAIPLSRLSMGRVAHGVHRERSRAVARESDIEVSVRFETKCHGYDVVVRGRIDALVDDDEEGLIVEEVKTVLRRGSRLPRDANAPGLENYRKQVLLYAFLVQEERDCPVRCRLALVSAVDGRCSEIPVPYDRSEVDSFLAARLERIIREHRDDVDRACAKRDWAASLEFPFETMRPRQDELIQSVTEALDAKQPLLLSAPAGTGKTIGVLYPALRHALENGRRVFLVTAKNTQARMVQEMLERMDVASSPVRAMFLRSKAEMCATGELVCHEESCEYLRDMSWRLLASGLTSDLLSRGVVLPDLVYETASAHRLCPFYTSMDMTRQADVIVGDYNYVFDPIAVLSHLFEDRSYRDFTLIVDEAHNLPGRVMEAYSPVLARRVLDEARAELNTSLLPLHVALVSILDGICGLLDEVRGSLDPARDDHPIDLDPGPWIDFRDELEPLLVRFLLSDERPPMRKGEDPILTFFFAFAQFLRVLEMEDLPHLVYYRFRPDEELRIQNLDPSTLIADRLKGFGGTVLMSATLAPSEYYTRLLGLDSPDTLEVALPSPFPPENREILIDTSVSTRYRDRGAAYPRVAGLIQDLVAVRPGNYLCFFPSFRFLYEVRERLDESRVELLVQRPTMGSRERQEVLEHLERPLGGRPRAVLAVQGGVFSEGVDYPGDLCIGVVVVGPGLPAVCFENERIRQYHDDRDGRGFEFAYLFPGLNRVIQSAGRLIRTPQDQGVLVLVGERFDTEAYRAHFPDEWKDPVSGARFSPDVVEAAAAFWEAAHEASPDGTTFFEKRSRIR